MGGIADLLRSTGFINLDFADLKAILRQSGLAHLGISEASGKGKVDEAAAAAIRSDLTETSVNGARRVIVNMTVSQDLAMEDVTTLMEKIQEAAHPDANIIFGLGYDETLVDALRLIVIATDFAGEDSAEGKKADASNDAAAAAVEKQRGGSPDGEKGVQDEEWDKWLNELFGKQ